MSQLPTINLLTFFFWLYSPVNPVTNVVPLSLVLLVSLIKEAWEDRVSTVALAHGSVPSELFFLQRHGRCVACKTPYG